MNNRILGVETKNDKKTVVLEKIQKYLQENSSFCHVVSLNPENLIVAQTNEQFKNVLNQAQIRLIDGVGVAWGARILGVSIGDRTTGVDMMKKLFSVASEKRLTVVLIGGNEKIAEKVVECQQDNYPEAKFIALQGIKNIKKPTHEEEENIFSIVADRKPHFLFAAFGSPDQELWLYNNRERLKGVVCMGVGGAFDFLSGAVPRAPRLVRQIGLEWFFRLTVQPWRIRRQIKLLKFIWLVIREKSRI